MIEDQPKDRRWLIRTLSEAGYSVETAATGAEAIEMCQTETFDGITLDLALPDMSGIQVLQTLRASGRNRETPVIVVSVSADAGLGSGFGFAQRSVSLRQHLALREDHRMRARQVGGKRVL